MNDEILDNFPDEKILYVAASPWYVDIVKFLVSGILPLIYLARPSENLGMMQILLLG